MSFPDDGLGSHSSCATRQAQAQVPSGVFSWLEGLCYAHQQGSFWNQGSPIPFGFGRILSSPEGGCSESGSQGETCLSLSLPHPPSQRAPRQPFLSGLVSGLGAPAAELVPASECARAVRRSAIHTPSQALQQPSLLGPPASP